MNITQEQNFIPISFSTFLKLDIIRKDDTATVDLGEELELPGFYTNASKNDFEIYEEAYKYYKELLKIYNNGR